MAIADVSECTQIRPAGGFTSHDLEDFVVKFQATLALEANIDLCRQTGDL